MEPRTVRAIANRAGGVRERAIPSASAQCSDVVAKSHHRVLRKEMAVTIVVLGIDLAKNVFALHGADGAGRVVQQRPSMRFVPVKSEGAVEIGDSLRTRWPGEGPHRHLDRIRGILSEFGIVLPLKAQTVRRRTAESLDTLPGWTSTAIHDLLAEAEVTRLDERITEYDQHIHMMADADERSERLMTLSGIGPTTACALLASIGNGHDFKNSGQLAAWCRANTARAVNSVWAESPRRVTATCARS